ncbi:MAG: hypothetical protein JSS04_19150 [Proteobacteria bacterium]|nr:hypothetical protein [Pseudomonadota bacterium]
MTTNEFYYLLLVVGSFGALAAGMSIATMQYKTWLRRQVAETGAAPRRLDRDIDRPHHVRHLADAT